MKEIQKFGIYALVVFLAYASVYTLIRNENIVTPFNDVALVVVSLIATILGYSAARVYGWGSVGGKIFYIFSTGVFLFFLGELSWMIYEVILGVEVPYPSIADAFWLGGLVAIIMAVYFKIFSTGVKEQLSKFRILTSVIICLVLLSFSLYFVLIPLLVSPESEFEGGILEKEMSIAYPIGEIVMMFGAIGIYAAHRRGTLGLTWGLIILYLILNYIFDASFSYLTWNNLYYTGHPIDLLYFAGYLLLILGFKNQTLQFTE